MDVLKINDDDDDDDDDIALPTCPSLFNIRDPIFRCLYAGLT